jgi:hypothetical protein
MWRTGLLLVALLVALVPGAGFGSSTTAGSISLDSFDVSDFPTMRLSASVTAVSGKPDASLETANFEVLQGGVSARDVAVVREQTGAVDLVFAIDLSGSQVAFIEQSRQAAIDVVQSLQAADRVQVIAFGDQTDVLLPLTADRAAIDEVLNGLRAIPNSNTAMNSAILTAVQAADAADAPGRVVVVISDGEEYGGRSTAVEGQIAEAALARGVQIYSVYVGDQTPSVLFNELPNNTGGLRLTWDQAAGVGAHVTETLRSRYHLEFSNSAATDVDPAQIVVRVKSRETLEAAANLCEGSSQPIVWLPGLSDGQKVSGERRIEPRLLCPGDLTVHQATYFVGSSKVADVATPPFTYNLITDKLAREAHLVRVETTLTDGTTIASRPVSVTVSGSPFNPALLLIILGIAAAMIVTVFALLRRKQRMEVAPAAVSAAAMPAPQRIESAPVIPAHAPAPRVVRPEAEGGRHRLLRVVRGPTEGQTYELGLSLVLGRAPTADVLLSGSSISREHARIWLEGSTYRIRDLGSTNGTLVNGRRVTEAVLEAGDKIEIRPFVFEFGAQA